MWFETKEKLEQESDGNKDRVSVLLSKIVALGKERDNLKKENDEFKEGRTRIRLKFNELYEENCRLRQKANLNDDIYDLKTQLYKQTVKHEIEKAQKNQEYKQTLDSMESFYDGVIKVKDSVIESLNNKQKELEAIIANLRQTAGFQSTKIIELAKDLSASRAVASAQGDTISMQSGIIDIKNKWIDHKQLDIAKMEQENKELKSKLANHRTGCVSFCANVADLQMKIAAWKQKNDETTWRYDDSIKVFQGKIMRYEKEIKDFQNRLAKPCEQRCIRVDEMNDYYKETITLYNKKINNLKEENVNIHHYNRSLNKSIDEHILQKIALQERLLETDDLVTYFRDKVTAVKEMHHACLHRYDKLNEKGEINMSQIEELETKIAKLERQVETRNKTLRDVVEAHREFRAELKDMIDQDNEVYRFFNERFAKLSGFAATKGEMD